MLHKGNKAGFFSHITRELQDKIPSKRVKDIKKVTEKIKNLRQKWQSSKNTMTKKSGVQGKKLWSWFWDCDAVFQNGQDKIRGGC